MRTWLVVTLLSISLVAIIAIVFYVHHRSMSPSTTSTSQQPMPVTESTPPATEPQPATPPVAEPAPKPAVVDPIADFKPRITKKHFGDYITPATSPVQPERFSGYHTGDDVEYTDTTDDVPVYAIVDATVVRASWVSGYGGLLVLKGSIKGNDGFILYGHVRESSLPKVGATVKQGDQVGVLGTGNSHETDGERHHLHFAIYTGNPIDIRGYVQNKYELSSWMNPLDLYQ